MNFLAHSFLSGNRPKTLVGNFMGDFVKGKQFHKYEEGIVTGILLHREIDFFTDNHAVVNQSKIRLRPRFGHFAAVIVDVFYDHLLAANWSKYSDIPLPTFVADVYRVVQEHFHVLPGKLQQILPSMIQHNWLESYAHIDGIKRSLRGMSHRSKFNPEMERAVDELQRDREELNMEFNAFFPEVAEFARDFLLEH